MSLQITPIHLKNDIQPKDDLVDLLLSSSKTSLENGNVLVISQKIISKHDGRVVNLDSIIPSELSIGIASAYDKDPKLVQAIHWQCVTTFCHGAQNEHAQHDEDNNTNPNNALTMTTTNQVGRPAVLAMPRDLYQLWNEYIIGLNNNKPAGQFTAQERGRWKHKYT